VSSLQESEFAKNLAENMPFAVKVVTANKTYQSSCWGNSLFMMKGYCMGRNAFDAKRIMSVFLLKLDLT